MRIIFGVDNIWGGYLGSVNGSRHRCSHLHSRRPVAVFSLRGRRSRSDVSISSHCNLHKGGSCGCLGVAGASASFERGSLGFNEPIQFGLIRPIHYCHDKFLSAVSRVQVFRTFIMDPAVRTKFVHMQIRSHSTVYCTSVSTCIVAFGWIWLKVHSLQNAVALNGKSGSLQQPALAS